MQALWRLPLLVLTLAAALPSFRTGPASHEVAAAFVAAQDTPRIETQIPVLPLLGRGAESGGAVRLLALLAADSTQLISAPGRAASLPVHPSIAAPAASGVRGRAPPATL